MPQNIYETALPIPCPIPVEAEGVLLFDEDLISRQTAIWATLSRTESGYRRGTAVRKFYSAASQAVCASS